MDATSGTRHSITAATEDSGKRLDRFLAEKIPTLSRSRIKRLIEGSHVTIGPREETSPGAKIRSGDTVAVTIPEPAPLSLSPSPVEFTVLHEDRHIIVLEKPAGLTVHPGAGREEKTLVHGLLHHCSDLSGIGDVMRPGIVHRLDKDTSGIMVVAKDDESHSGLVRQFASGLVEKTYLALVSGHMKTTAGEIRGAIGRHPVHRKRMAVLPAGGRDAWTEWRVHEEFAGASLLVVRIRTGRTHQIRAHMSFIGRPLLGDPLYGGPTRVDIRGRPVSISRQMLHAHRLCIVHPVTGERMAWETPMPWDMETVTARLREKGRSP